MPNKKEEADLLINSLYDDWGTGGFVEGEIPWVSGYSAICEMKDDDFPAWGEVEWAGFYIKYLIQKAVTMYPDIFQICNLPRKRYLIKGSYLWDARYNTFGKTYLILSDVDEYSEIIRENHGIGVLIFECLSKPDVDKSFLRWHERLKKGPSGYTQQRELRGRSYRIRKESFAIYRASALFLTENIIAQGISKGWLDDTFQKNMRNSDGSTRNAKFKIFLDRLPSDLIFTEKNFNILITDYDDEE